MLNPFHTIPSFADFPGNLAGGESAPDFALNLLDGAQFILSEQIGENYLLVLNLTPNPAKPEPKEAHAKSRRRKEKKK